MDQRQHWIVTADNRRAALFACRRLPGGGMHVEQLRTIENEHEGEHERHRPALLGGAERRGGRGHSSARAAPQSISLGHEVEEEQRRFAREVRDWLANASRELSLGRVNVFAAPRFLGLLRDQMGDRNNTAVLHEGELTHLRPHELATHPAVLTVIGPSSAGPR